MVPGFRQEGGFVFFNSNDYFCNDAAESMSSTFMVPRSMTNSIYLYYNINKPSP